MDVSAIKKKKKKRKKKKEKKRQTISICYEI
jgi:hypothetical protein